MCSDIGTINQGDMSDVDTGLVCDFHWVPLWDVSVCVVPSGGGVENGKIFMSLTQVSFVECIGLFCAFHTAPLQVQ